MNEKFSNLLTENHLNFFASQHNIVSVESDALKTIKKPAHAADRVSSEFRETFKFINNMSIIRNAFDFYITHSHVVDETKIFYTKNKRTKPIEMHELKFLFLHDSKP